MPIYEFVCQNCNYEFEKIQSFSDTTVPVCANCGSDQVSRQLSPPAIHFKGSGWYITDSKKAAKDSASRNGSDSQSGASDTSGGSDSQSESKSKQDSGSSTPSTDGTSAGSDGTKTEASSAASSSSAGSRSDG